MLNLSHNPSQGFPFMVLSLNVSNIVLKALKDGHIDKYDLDDVGNFPASNGLKFVL